MRTFATALLLLVACDGTGTGTTGDTPPTTETDAPTTDLQLLPIDTGYPQGDKGSLMIMHRQPVGEPPSTELLGVFVDDHPGFHNLAECVVHGPPCILELPDEEDDSIDLDTNRPFEVEEALFSYLGLGIGFGPYTLNIANDAETGVANYEASLPVGEAPQSGWYGVSFDKQWGTYEGTEDLLVTNPIQIITPAAGSVVNFVNDSEIIIEWVPQGRGDVFLIASNPSLDRMWLLEDDGYFALDVDDLDLGVGSATINFTLRRWNRDELTFQGHLLDLISQSEVSFRGQYIYVSNAELYQPPDTCAQAFGATPVQGGDYFGIITSYADDLNPSCVSGNSADALIPISLGPREELTVAYTLQGENASIYLLDDCTDPDTCLASSNEFTNSFTNERLSWFNNSDERRDVFLVLDGVNATQGKYWVRIILETLLEPDVHDTCALAQADPDALAPGKYFAEDVSQFTGVLNPGNGGCTGAAHPGPEAMTKVTIQPGQTMTALVHMEDASPALYLVIDCVNPFTCLAGADTGTDSTASLSYTNETGGAQTLYLVVDTALEMKPYKLTVSTL